MDCSDATRQSVFDFPKDCPSKIDIMLHEPHPTVFGPAFFVIVTNDILIVWIGILSKESLNQFSRFISHKSKDDVNMVNVSHVHSDWMPGLNFDGLEKHEFVFIFRRTC